MKKIILAVTLLAFVGSQVQPAKAGPGPAIAAGVLGGLAVGTVVGASIASQPTYYAPAPVYYYPPQTVYGSGTALPPAPAVTPAPSTSYQVAPAPSVVYSQPAPTVVYAPPVYYPPAPVISLGFGWGWGHPYYGHYGYGHYGYGHRHW